MSAFGGKADVRELPAVCPLIARSGHSTVIPAAWILRSLVVSLLGEGERAWNADLPPFLLRDVFGCSRLIGDDEDWAK